MLKLSCMTINDPTRLMKMQAAFAARDRAAAGSFVVAVKTPGIFCRPSCPARRPRPENIEFFTGNADAAAAGYRACKRCRPDEVTRDEAAVRAAIDEIKLRHI